MGNRISKKISDRIMEAIPLVILVLGITSSQKGDTIIVIISLVIGVITGETLKIDNKIEKMGEFFKNLLIKDKEESKFQEAFIVTSLLFCVGSMSILGSLDAGISKNYEVLFIKSLLDGIVALILSSMMGYGVLVAAVPVLIYEGAITLLANLISPLLSENVVANITGVGGIMLIALSISMLKIKEFKVENMLPAILIPIIYELIIKLI